MQQMKLKFNTLNMKFYDNSGKMNISIFLIICSMLANYNSIFAYELDNNINEKSSFLDFNERSFLTLQESKKEMSEDMQYQNFFVIKFIILIKK